MYIQFIYINREWYDKKQYIVNISVLSYKFCNVNISPCLCYDCAVLWMN